jgi:hypothetical protein
LYERLQTELSNTDLQNQVNEIANKLKEFILSTEAKKTLTNAEEINVKLNTLTYAIAPV